MAFWPLESYLSGGERHRESRFVTAHQHKNRPFSDWCKGCETGKSEKEREMERAMEELKKAVVLETGDITVASCCMGVSELSAAGKFLGSGVGEARKAVGQMETAVNRMV